MTPEIKQAAEILADYMIQYHQAKRNLEVARENFVAWKVTSTEIRDLEWACAHCNTLMYEAQESLNSVCKRAALEALAR